MERMWVRCDGSNISKQTCIWTNLKELVLRSVKNATVHFEKISWIPFEYNKRVQVEPSISQSFMHNPPFPTPLSPAPLEF